MRESLSSDCVCLQSEAPTFHLHFPDIDECKSGEPCGPNSRCHNTNGSFYCTCQRDYIPTSGTQHFHPERGAGCKGQYWKREKCTRKNTHAGTRTHTHTITCATCVKHIYLSSSLFFITFWGRSICYAIHQVKVQSQIFSCFEKCWSSWATWCYSTASPVQFKVFFSFLVRGQTLRCWNHAGEFSNRRDNFG